MGNNTSHGAHSASLKLATQSSLSVSQPTLVATTSEQLLQPKRRQLKRPKSDTYLLYRGTSSPTPPREKVREVPSPTSAQTPLRRTNSRRSGTRYSARSASLRRQRSVLRRNGHFTSGKNRLKTMRRTIALEADQKMAEEQKELCVAAARGDIDAVEAMVDSGTDVNSADENKQTVLHYASMHARDEVILSLIHRGADVNATDVKGGFSGLHWVVINADPQLCATDHVSRSLVALANGGCNVNCTNFNFATPLHIAAQKGNKVCIETLIKLGADPDKVDITGRNCYDIAKNPEIREFIHKVQREQDSSHSVDSHAHSVTERNPSPIPSLSKFTTQQQTQDKQKTTEHYYHVLELSPPSYPAPQEQTQDRQKTTEHHYHVLELPPPSYPAPPPPLESPIPPRPTSSTPPPPPPRRRRGQYVQYDILDTHIYHVLEAPPPRNKPPSPPRRRKALVRRN